MPHRQEPNRAPAPRFAREAGPLLAVAGGPAPPAEVLKVRSARLAAQWAGPAPQAAEFVQPEGLALDALVLVLEPRAAR